MTQPATQPLWGPRSSLAIFAIRAIVGLAFIFHARMKLPHASFWMGPNGFAPPWLQAVVTYAELIGGICLILGLATALFAFILSIDMLVAIFKFHIPAGGHFVGGPGPSFEVPLVYLVVLVALLIAGPGNFSVDALFRRRRRRNG